MSIEQAINQALQFVNSEDSWKEFHWAAPIVSELSELDFDLLIKWSGKCIKIYLSEFNNPKRNELEKYLKEVTNSWNSYTPSECVSMSRKVWYLRGVRDEAQASLSHLWAVVKDYKETDINITMATMVVTLLLPEMSNRDLLNKSLEAATTIYQEYKSNKK